MSYHQLCVSIANQHRIHVLVSRSSNSPKKTAVMTAANQIGGHRRLDENLGGLSRRATLPIVRGCARQAQAGRFSIFGDAQVDSEILKRCGSWSSFVVIMTMRMRSKISVLRWRYPFTHRGGLRAPQKSSIDWPSNGLKLTRSVYFFINGTLESHNVTLESHLGCCRWCLVYNPTYSYVEAPLLRGAKRGR